jgi:DNA-binding MarR family transcriptional regulator
MPKNSDASGVSPSIALAGELRAAIAKLIRRWREQAQAGDFTDSQKSVIRRLERDGPATVSALAKAENVRHQSMRVTVASLETAGAVSGQPDPADGRQNICTLTPAFLKILKTGRAAKEDWLFRALQAQLTPRERKELAAAVEFLNRLSEF